MNKKFTQSLFILIFLNLLVKPFYIFAIERSIQNKVGAEEYGMYFSLLGFSLVFNMISDFGITSYNNRNIAANHDQLTIQLGTLIPIKLFISIIYCLVTLFLAYFINYSPEQFELLIWLVINQILISFILYLRSNISGIQLFNIDSLISVIDKLFLIILCSFLLWGSFSSYFSIKHFVLAQTFSYLITLIFASYIVYSNSGKINFEINFKSLFITLKQSYPYAILMFLMVAYNRIDAVMLERLLPNGKIQAGIYAQSFRLIDALSMFAYLFASILLPLFAKMLKEQNSINEILKHSFSMLFIPSIGLVSALLLYANDFMEILYQQHVENSAMVLKFLSFSYLGICFTYIFGTLITASGKIKLLNKISFFGLMFNIGLNVLVIPIYGLIGAAISSALTQVGVGLIQLIFALKIFKISIQYKMILKYLILILFVSIFSFYINFDSIAWYISFSAIPVYYVIGGFFLKLIKFENFKTLFTSI